MDQGRHVVDDLGDERRPAVPHRQGALAAVGDLLAEPPRASKRGPPGQRLGEDPGLVDAERRQGPFEHCARLVGDRVGLQPRDRLVVLDGGLLGDARGPADAADITGARGERRANCRL